ncbi:N-acetylmuramic acid 6-phosphate etherase [Salipaludibacillus neizhouensis]|uniref:N-acetylmuramic acid 6-phosphate etherase n=1 Tax=Salipaludibacillus neizhouensis TaxID=885475 RepID=A0A3A9K1H9_9BACI|nr:N-acetylmuramic acid 6-phosphate etherase [Salipaludibacillus neizhouensis]RKL66954.1 N-acetylmuramic acid 6-phosphate etherase [Salipaludibacillus neizhouensis]
MNDLNVTESVNVNSLTIDEMGSMNIVTLMLEEDRAIHQGIKQALPNVAKVVDLIVEQWKLGGRVFVVGAGTSGRLGVLDAVELGPTFSIEDNRWIGLIAGGKEAMWSPLEQHEDEIAIIENELRNHSLNKKDVVIGVSASGSTPYSVTAIKYAKKLGAKAVSISCNHNTISSQLSDCGIEVIAGPEVIRGSTRLKAGTAQKIILNMISTATMIQLGKVYQNQMVDMQLINKKLVKRAEQTLMDLVNISENEAKDLMTKSNHDLKAAIFINITQTELPLAKNYLEREKGHLKNAISSYFKENS